jgi:hypothetical protein
MNIYIKFLFAVILFFGVSSTAFADPVSQPGATTTPQPFTVTCTDYTTPFTAGGYFSPNGGECSYTLPQQGNYKAVGIYKGTVGSSTPVKRGFTIGNPATVLTDTGYSFTGAIQEDNFFAAAYSSNTFSDVESADNYLQNSASGTPTADITTVAWKWCTTYGANCNSNVMFLPGIEGSSLYSLNGSENRIWPPDSLVSTDVDSLDLNNSSTLNNVYTKNNDVISGYGYYDSLISQMNSLVSSGSFVEWEPIAYDWRLDYQTLLSNGAKTSDGKIYYRGSNAATSTPYIIQELKRLAASSRTGKVTIIAHSNGGLLAKALLTLSGMSQYVDKIVLIGTPQIGTTKAIDAILHGHKSGFSGLESLVFDDADARFLGLRMLPAYNLLPSFKYFEDILNPAVVFDTATLSWMASKYGSNISSTSTLRAFMTDPTRPTPSVNDLKTPAVASSTLFDAATAVHSSLDNWSAPAGVQVIAIAGWGDPTLVTLKYYKTYTILDTSGYILNSTTTYPVMAIDGDGTVVDASAVWTNTSTSTKYWVNLLAQNQASSSKIEHANIFNASSLRSLISILVTNGPTSTLPSYVSTSRPIYTDTDPRVYYVAHSPITIGFKDSFGNYSGSTATTTILNVPGVQYERFGEVQWLSVPASTTGQVIMKGTGSGSFTLDVQSVNGNTYLASTTFAAVPVATGTIATINLSPSVSPTASSTLLVDSDGNGTTDIRIQASQNAIILPPVLKLVSTSTGTYVVHYENMPASTTLAFANGSHQIVAGYRTPLSAGGTGTTTIIAYGLAGGYNSFMALGSTSTSTIIETPQFYVNGTSNPQITYSSANTAGQTVTVTYNRIPTNAELVFVNVTSGAVVAGHATMVSGVGTSTISTAGITPYGSYYLRARDASTHTTPNYAQSVNFYISDPNDEGL